MVGNDLICFKSNPKRADARHERYLAKTFTEKEREVITTSRFWFLDLLFWSAKEAAFKIYMQKNPTKEKFYAPKKFEVFCEEISERNANGLVQYLNQTYYFSAQINQEYLHTVACISAECLPEIFSSMYLKKENRARRIHNPEVGEIQISKNQFGIPKAFSEGEELAYAVSVSHDGEWEAVVILGN